MKENEYKVDRDSWHYRFLNRLAGKDRVEEIKNSCNYKLTVWVNLLGILYFGVGILLWAFIIMKGQLFSVLPSLRESLIGLGTLVIMIAIWESFSVLFTKFIEQRKWYQTFKGKLCRTVVYK